MSTIPDTGRWRRTYNADGTVASLTSPDGRLHIRVGYDTGARLYHPSRVPGASLARLDDAVGVEERAVLRATEPAPVDLRPLGLDRLERQLAWSAVLALGVGAILCSGLVGWTS